MTQITRLLDVFGQTRRTAPVDLAAFLDNLPDVGALPSPWETWTLIGFVRHRERQYWVRDIIHTRLRGDSEMLGAMGALGHPDGVKQSGSVPGMPEWEYYFHGRGCCLTHKVTGEDIDVDFWDDTAEYFDVYFYTNYLKSLRNPDVPERRLLELHGSVRPIGIAVNRLQTAGAMTPLPGRDSHPPRIAEEVLAYSDAIEAFCLDWGIRALRIWLAGIIGDWLAADEAAAGQPAIQRITGPRAEKCRSIRREQLLQVSGHAAADALFGLAELGGADDQLEAAFRGPPSGTISAALEIVGKQDNPKWCPHIYSLFKRMRPTEQIPAPHIWMTSLKFLLRHGYHRDEMIASLAKVRGTGVGEGVLLALEQAPEHALPLIRKALVGDIPCDRTTVAAVLGLIAKPWSIRELLTALAKSDDQEKTADARAALLEIGDPEAEKAVLAWEERNPHEEEPGYYLDLDGRKVGPFYSMTEHMLKSRASFVRYEMDQLYDRVKKIKDVVPPEPLSAKRWWKFWGC
ncbi:MAG: hypothetical protein JSS02_01870 [Planctomycetes bacterium]|nr:hypothetical protein [Planctomycetota bacterium]